MIEIESKLMDLCMDVIIILNKLLDHGFINKAEFEEHIKAKVKFIRKIKRTKQ